MAGTNTEQEAVWESFLSLFIEALSAGSKLPYSLQIQAIKHAIGELEQWQEKVQASQASEQSEDTKHSESICQMRESPLRSIDTRKESIGECQSKTEGTSEQTKSQTVTDNTDGNSKIPHSVGDVTCTCTQIYSGNMGAKNVLVVTSSNMSNESSVASVDRTGNNSGVGNEACLPNVGEVKAEPVCLQDESADDHDDADLDDSDDKCKSQQTEVPRTGRGRPKKIRPSFVYQCRKCDSSFTEKENFMNHQKKHLEQVCDICNQRIPTKRALGVHKRLKHSKKRDSKPFKGDSPHIAKIIGEVEVPDSCVRNEVLVCPSVVEVKPEPMCSPDESGGDDDDDDDDDDGDDLGADNHDSDESYNPSSEEMKQTEGHRKRTGTPKKTKPPPVYECKKCDCSFTDKDMFSNHQKKHLERVCDICNERVPTKRALVVHKRLKHIKPPPERMCDICNQRVPTKRALVVHKRLKHFKVAGKPGRPKKIRPSLVYECKKCDLSFNDKENFTKHQKIHFERVCNICDQRVPSKRALLVHRKLKHVREKDEGPFTCDVCSKVYTTKAILRAHKQIHIVGLQTCKVCPKTYKSVASLHLHMQLHNPKKQCPHCDHKAPNESYLKKHIDRTHFKDDDSRKRFMCDKCDRRFHTMHHLMRHIESHSMEKNHACPYCDHKSHSASLITSHIKNVHSERELYVCNICGATCKFKLSLEQHQRRHFNDKPYKCPKCPYRAASSSNMGTHAKTHDEPSLPCPLCGKMFKTRSHLFRHQVIHTGKKDNSCPHCSYSCNVPSNLRKHLKMVHKMALPPSATGVLKISEITLADDNDNMGKSGSELQGKQDPVPGQLPKPSRKQQKHTSKEYINIMPVDHIEESYATEFIVSEMEGTSVSEPIGEEVLLSGVETMSSQDAPQYVLQHVQSGQLAQHLQQNTIPITASVLNNGTYVYTTNYC